MRLDPIDNTLICQGNDLQSTLHFFKEDCVLPSSIELGILKVVYDSIGVKALDSISVEAACNCIPKEFINVIVTQINDFFSQAIADYTGKHLAYLLYYLPANIYKVWKPLTDLLAGQLLKANIRVLDIGTGPGSIPVGMIEYYKLLAKSFPSIYYQIDFTLIDSQKEFLLLAEKMVESVCRDLPNNLKINVSDFLQQQITPVSCKKLPRNFDIKTCSNVLTTNEGINRFFADGLVRALASLLLKHSAMIIIEPGDKLNGIAFKQLRNRIINNHIFSLYAPCVDIWNERGAYNCTCFNPTRSYWTIPIIYEYLLKRGVRKAARESVPFHYAVFRNDETKKYEDKPSPHYYTKLADLSTCDGKIVNIMAMVRSVFDEGDSITLHLCDGTNWDDSKVSKVKLLASKSILRKKGIEIRFLSAERLTIKKAKVNVNNFVELHLQDVTTIVIDF